MNFKFDICDEFDCRPWYCKAIRGCDCKGEFWKNLCMFYDEHIELNEVKMEEIDNKFHRKILAS